MSKEVADAKSAWEKAPMHVRTLAGAYVGPLMAALVALDQRLEKLEKEGKNG